VTSRIALKIASTSFVVMSNFTIEQLNTEQRGRRAGHGIPGIYDGLS